MTFTSVFKYFDNPKAIISDRDPRDTYVFAKEFLLSKGRQIPTDSVENFIIYYKNMRKQLSTYVNHEDIIYLRFEDLIYRYDNSIEKIKKFLNVETHYRKREIFDPNLSINNTQVYKRYPKYKEDIDKIEKELPEYLYDFESFDIKPKNGEMFYGKSPLNKKQNLKKKE